MVHRPRPSAEPAPGAGVLTEPIAHVSRVGLLRRGMAGGRRHQIPLICSHQMLRDGVEQNPIRRLVRLQMLPHGVSLLGAG